MNGLSRIGDFMPDFGGRLAIASGECAIHGAADALVRTGSAWHCRECLDEQMAVDHVARLAAERTAMLVKLVGIPPRYQGQKFVASTPAQKQVRQIAAAFRDAVIPGGVWACLVLVGDVGTGKTLLACEFAESYINRLYRSVRLITAKSMIAAIQSSYGREGKSEDVEIDRFVQCDLLILDEVDAIANKDNASLLLTEIINRRYSANKPMIVITNQPFADLGQFVGDRVLDRMHENAFVCDCDWPSYRRRP